MAAVIAASMGWVRPVAAAPAGLTDPDAKAHFERAQRAFSEQDYEAAIPELKAAYALEPNPMLLYAWAQAERLAGSCARAVELYRRFLATGPEAEQRQLAEANLLDCEAELPDVPPPQTSDANEDEAAEDPDEGDEEPAAPKPDRPTRKWYTDPVGGALAGSGAAFAIAGGAMMGVARSRVNNLAVAVEDDYLRETTAATRLNTAGIVVLGAGGALLLGAGIRYAIVARKGAAASATAWRVQPVWLGRGLGLRGRF